MERYKVPLFLTAGLIMGLLFGGIVYIALPGGAAASRRPDPPTTGAEMADFTVEGLNRADVSLSDLRGKPVILNFWASWCPPCREEMPLLKRLSSEYGGQVYIIGLNYAEDAVTVQDFVTENRITFPVWLDPQGKISDLYYVHSYPTTFFIDAEGILRAQHIGQLLEDDLSKYLSAIGVTP